MKIRIKGFTLVELLAVIVILSVILVISIPKILNTIDDSKTRSIESTVKMVATSAEKEYITRMATGTLNQITDPINCNDIVKINSDDYESCTVEFDSENKAYVSIVGKGKLKGYSCVNSTTSNTSCTDKEVYQETLLNGAYPRLDDGMIPIVVENDGTIKTVDPSSSSWYSYSERKWANVVLVKTSGTKSRQYYKDNYNVTINNSDILAYFVWIPRYKYQLFLVYESVNAYKNEESLLAYNDGEDNEIAVEFILTPNSNMVNVVFEGASTEKSAGTELDQYLTHPAFTFGGIELNGLWVGKFETTGTSTNPTILPNNKSLTNQNISDQFISSQLFSNNNYGLKSESRMTKNNDWAAVLYLANSVYGRFIDSSNCISGGCLIWPNNVSTCSDGEVCETITGCSGTTAKAIPSWNLSACESGYSWSGLGVNASTTGNKYGVYDMNGGNFEAIMGVLEDSDGHPRSGNDLDNNSGYNGMLYDSSYLTSGKSLPANKYYSSYDYDDNYYYHNGDGLFENYYWMDHDVYFADMEYSWFLRGGYYANSQDYGTYIVYGYPGMLEEDITFRTVIGM